MTNLLSGTEFNKRYPSTRFVKLTTESENHNGFQFKTGRNVDTVEFDPTGECKKGGIYFCEIDKIARWVHYSDKLCVNYREVIIESDAQVYIERDKFKADKIILLEKMEIWSDEKICKIIVSQDPSKWKFIKNQIKEICKPDPVQNPGNVFIDGIIKTITSPQFISSALAIFADYKRTNVKMFSEIKKSDLSQGNQHNIPKEEEIFSVIKKSSIPKEEDDMFNL
jgi:hypothetical protein